MYPLYAHPHAPTRSFLNIYRLAGLPLLLCLACLVLGACSHTGAGKDALLKDLRTLPQHSDAYYPKQEGCQPLMSRQTQNAMYLRFRENWFSPWQRETPVSRKDSILWPVDAFRNSTLYGPNLRPLPADWLEKAAARADMDTFPNTRLRGISVNNTVLRALPTDQPAFRDPKQAGEGFPFDYMQNTAIWAATPLFLAHTSADGEWIFAEAPHVSGWIPARDVAYVDDALARTFSSAPLLAVIRDRSALHDDFGLFRFQGRIGCVLPLMTRSRRGWETLLPVRNIFGQASAVPAVVATSAATPMPWPMTRHNMSLLINQLTGQPYGWGGLYGHRDCSSSQLDLFTPFGLGLPRNSRDQAANGQVIALEGLSPQEKEALILEKGLPFRTLIGMPGHIMLYLGKYDGRAVVFHTTWGVKTLEDGNWGPRREGRHLVGRGVISTLSLGRELSGLKHSQGRLTYPLATMTLLGR
jgi:hypothetical protein